MANYRYHNGLIEDTDTPGVFPDVVDIAVTQTELENEVTTQLEEALDSGTTYTQTYSTAATTVPNATYAATAANDDEDTTELIADVAALAADVLALKKVITQLIDDLQTVGIVS